VSYYEEIKAAAGLAETILAGIQGAPAGGKNLVIDGRGSFLGVFGAPIVASIPAAGGGYRKKTSVPLTITREQLAKAPAPNTRITRTDLPTSIVYEVEHVATHDPFVWVIALANFTQ